MKIKQLLIAIVLLLAATNLSAQFDYSFSGYVVNFPIYSKSPKFLADALNVDENQFSNLTRVRLRPVFYLWEGARINLDYEMASIYFNSANLFLNPNSGKSKTQLVRMNWNLLDKKNFRVNHFIDRLYLKQSFDFGSVTIGRQRISWGTGRTWNPTDLFNPKNPANFSKIEKDGADAVSAKYFIGDFTDLHVVFNPLEKFDESNFGARFRTNVSEYDFSVMGGRFNERIVGGFDFAGNLFKAGVRGEGIISIDENNSSDNFVKFIIGADYQFTSKFYTLIEYHFNGEGKAEKSEYEIRRLALGEIINLGKKYFNISSTYQYTPLLTFSISVISNIEDKSGLLALTGNYSLMTDFYLNAGSQISFGENFSEYKFYGSSYFLQIEYYF